MHCSSTPREFRTARVARRLPDLAQSSDSYSCLKKFLLLVISIYIGISIGIPGCTLIFIEKITGAREDEVALIFSARAVGSLAGWLLGLLVLDMKNAFNPSNLLWIGAFGLFLVYLLLIWATHIWWVMCGFAFQGSFLVITTQGCLACVKSARLQYKPHWSQQMIFACLLGCVIAPFASFPFLQHSAPLPNSHTLSLFVLQNHRKPNLTVHSNSRLPDAIRLHRSPRAVVSTVDFVPIADLNHADPVLVHSTDNSLGETSSMVTRTTTEVSEYPTVQFVSNPTTTTPLIVTNSSTTTLVPLSTIPPTKPVINDARHLNQDSSSADGSQAASKMKQLGEERKIDTLAGVPEVPLLAAPVKTIEVATPFPQVHLLNQTLMVSIPMSTTSSANTNETLEVESNSQDSVTTLPDLPASVQNSNSTNNNSVLSIDVDVPSSGSLLREQMDLHTNESALTRVITNMPDTHSSVPSILDDKSAHDEDLIPGNKIYTPEPVNSVNLTDSEIQQVSTTTTTASTTGHLPDGTTINLVRIAHRKHIAEHRSVTDLIHRRYLNDRLMPIQKVYLTLSLAGFAILVIALSLTKCSQSECCSSLKSSTGVRNSDEVRLFHLNADAEDECDCADDLESAVERRMLLPVEDVRAAHQEHGDYRYDPGSNFENSFYATAEETCFRTQSNTDFTTPRKRDTHEPLSITEAPTCRLSLRPDSPHIFLARPHWPRIRWPLDALLLLAEFFNVGLETAYGAFIHGFTIRYLFWSPALAFLAVSLFWLGDLVGRLPGVFVFETHRSVRLNTRSCSSNDNPTPSCIAETSDARPFKPTRWLNLTVRLSGALLCILTALVLTRRSVSTDRYTISTIPATGIPSPLSHDFFVWLGGSLFLGLGVGISSSPVGSVVAAQHTENAHRLQLAGLLGQLFVPPLVAYVHHLAVFWRYTCVLSISALVLGCLLSLTLLIKLFQTVSFPVGQSKLTQSFPSTSQNSELCKAESVVSQNDSPIMLHGVSEP